MQKVSCEKMETRFDRKRILPVLGITTSLGTKRNCLRSIQETLPANGRLTIMTQRLQYQPQVNREPAAAALHACTRTTSLDIYTSRRNSTSYVHPSCVESQAERNNRKFRPTWTARIYKRGKTFPPILDENSSSSAIKDDSLACDASTNASTQGVS